MSDEHLEQETAQAENADDALTPAGAEAEAEAGVAGDVRPQEDRPAESLAEQRSPEELAAALAEAERERNEYLDHLRRERAEFENFRRRSNRERMEALDRGAEALIADLLGVLDNFGYVLEAAKGSSDEAFAKGAEMVHNELRGVLARAGLAEVPGAGEPFDPKWHEAVQQVEPPEEQETDHPTVAAVLRPGYRFKGRVLRPASVSVYQS